MFLQVARVCIINGRFHCEVRSEQAGNYSSTIYTTRSLICQSYRRKKPVKAGGKLKTIRRYKYLYQQMVDNMADPASNDTMRALSVNA
jgi:hypothetical protein